MPDKRIIEIVKSFINDLKHKGVFCDEVYLFGSQLKGVAKETSDIDVLLISPQFDEEDEEILAKIWFSKIRTENRIEPILITPSLFNEENHSPLISMIKETGFLIAA